MVFDCISELIFLCVLTHSCTSVELVLESAESGFFIPGVGAFFPRSCLEVPAVQRRNPSLLISFAQFVFM